MFCSAKWCNTCTSLLMPGSVNVAKAKRGVPRVAFVLCVVALDRPGQAF